MATKETTTIEVGFNQQQRQLIEKLKERKTFGETDGEIVHAGFAAWLRREGLSS